MIRGRTKVCPQILVLTGLLLRVAKRLPLQVMHLPAAAVLLLAFHEILLEFHLFRDKLKKQLTVYENVYGKSSKQCIDKRKEVMNDLNTYFNV